MKRLAVLLVGLLLCAAGPARAEVVVFTPGGMADVMDELAKTYVSAGGAPIQVVVGHSPHQARQILEGAPADVFVSADPQWTQELSAKGALVPDSVGVIASAELVLVVQDRSTVTWEPGTPLGRVLGEEGRLAITDPATTPLGMRAKASLIAMGIWGGVEQRLALMNDDRSVIAILQRGEVPAGIAFTTDLAGVEGLKVAAKLPASSYAPITFGAGIVAGHARAEVREFRDWLASAPARAILTRRGFALP